MLLDKITQVAQSILPDNPDQQPILLRVRIVRSPNNQDGYVLRDLTTGKYGFIANKAIDWEQVVAGQIWLAEQLTTGDSYFKAQIVELVKS